MMLSGRDAPDIGALHPGLRDLIAHVDDHSRRVKGTGLTTSVVALIVVAWQDTHPELVAYNRKVKCLDRVPE